MKWIKPVIVCAAMIAFAGCDSGESEPVTPPDTNAPAAQAPTPEQLEDAAATANSTAQSVADGATAPAPSPAQN